jgi:hypothetical protein
MATEKRTYRYGNLEMKYDADYSPEEVRRIWATIYPDLKKADIRERDGYVEFVERPGTKG